MRAGYRSDVTYYTDATTRVASFSAKWVYSPKNLAARKIRVKYLQIQEGWTCRSHTDNAMVCTYITFEVLALMIGGFKTRKKRA
jgi:hypothetical protein